MVDKKRVLHKQVASAHLILWICSDLSTEGPARSAGFLFFSLTLVLAKVRPSRKTRYLVFSSSAKFLLNQVFQNESRVCVFCIAGEAARLSFLLFVYLKEMYTSIVVMVNAGTFLWIRP